MSNLPHRLHSTLSTLPPAPNPKVASITLSSCVPNQQRMRPQLFRFLFSFSAILGWPVALTSSGGLRGGLCCPCGSWWSVIVYNLYRSVICVYGSASSDNGRIIQWRKQNTIIPAVLFKKCRMSNRNFDIANGYTAKVRTETFAVTQ